jgi:ribosomal protein S1|tara:strand:- start:7870 stop:9192 length:1323 start_codon:yes stop_codon:yes gene_type:complete
MSTDKKQKKPRIGELTKKLVQDTPVKEAEVLETEAKIDETPNDGREWYNEAGEFDWDSFEATCPTRTRKPNPHIKTRKGERVFSRESYAQELYDIMDDHYESKGESLRFKISVGETIEGTVIGVDTAWCSIDIGYRESVYVDMSKESEISKTKLVPGSLISVQITGDQKSNQRGFILGSVEAGIKAATTREILSTIEEGTTAYVGTVVSMIQNGGYIVSIQGIECFMPGSLAGINKLVDFESIIDTDLYVVPMSYSPEKGTIVVSHRKYLQAMIPTRIEEISNDLSVVRTGNVTGSAKYGVFVEFDGCLTGMIHINDLDVETLKKHKSREINPGDSIDFKVKEVISNTKITLTQVEQQAIVDPWKLIAEKYTSFPVEVSGVVKSTKDYGVFLDVGEGVVGLLHVSELPDDFDKETIKKNDTITVQITRIEVETRKVFLKL